MGYWGFQKQENNTEEPDDGKDIEIHGDPSSIVAWRIDALVSEGFDPLIAGMLATLSNWRDAKPLAEKGCPQRLVWELLR